MTRIVIGAMRLAMMRKRRIQERVAGDHGQPPRSRVVTVRNTSWNIASVSRPVLVL
jgi:hypothetical protein